MSINNHKSSLLQLKSRVPQGSILDPLFITYVNDLSVASQLLGYADDTKCYKHIATPYDQQLLQDDLNSLFDWSKLVC